jgi:peptidoglycan hydrolase-like protein with peptidoglycan-binding domain
MTTATASTGTPLSRTQRDWLKTMKSALGSPGAVGADAGTVGAGPLDLALQWGPEIIALAKQLGARRKCLIAVVNNTTDRVIHRGDAKFKSGGFASIPKEDKIEPNGGKSEFIVASPENNPFGEVEGEVPWALDGETDWHVRFGNPRAGSVKASNDLDETPLKAIYFVDDPLKGNGDTAEIRYTIRGGKGQPKPNPKPTPGPNGTDVASSCLITITNNSKSTLTLLEPKPIRGNFTNFPPNTLAPNGTASIVFVETPNNKDPNDEGCKGSILWEVGSPRICTWLIEWDNPEGSQNTITHKLDPDGKGFRSVDQIGQGEENVPVSFTLLGDGGDQPPVPPSTSTKLLVTVTDQETADRVPGATVQIEQETKKTNEKGSTEFSPPAGKHRIHVTADGFEPNDDEVGVVDGQTTQFMVFLQKEAPFKPPTEEKQPTLRPGDPKRPDGWIEFLQSQLLKHLGQNKPQDFGVTGEFDAPTEAAVRQFQKDHKPKALQNDGVVGNQTWAALRKAPEEAVGTDGRKPHTFVEQGPKGRWVCEQTDFEMTFDKDKDELKLTAVSVGTEPIKDFAAQLFVTPENGKRTKLPPIKLGEPTLEREAGGDVHKVIVNEFRKQFGPGKHLIEAFLPQKLGGDNFKDSITIP